MIDMPADLQRGSNLSKMRGRWNLTLIIHRCSMLSQRILMIEVLAPPTNPSVFTPINGHRTPPAR